MKQYLLTAVILLSLLFAGCSERNDWRDDGGGRTLPTPAEEEGIFLEISPDSSSQVIEEEIAGITFKFCLLNEQGQPATVFKEGENFSFYFSSTNTGEKDLYFKAPMISVEKDFFRVYHSSGTDLGKSFVPIGVTHEGIFVNPFNIGDVYALKVPWLHEEGSLLYPCDSGCDGYFYGLFQEPLAKGSYYTKFRHSFSYAIQQELDFLGTDSVNFKINFQIQ